MSVTYKVFLDKMGGENSTTYIGKYGEIFYNPDTGNLRISDGHTPGGVSLTVEATSIVFSESLIPTQDVTYDIGSPSYRWNNIYAEALHVGANSVTFLDINPSFPSQVLTVANGVFFISSSANTSNQSNAGFRVGNFLLQNNIIGLTDPTSTFYIGSNVATGNLVINRPIVVYSTGTNTNPTFSVQRSGKVQISVPNTIPALEVGAFSIVGSSDGSIQYVTNPGGMLHITGNDGVSSRITVDAFGTGAIPVIVGRAGRGTANTPANTQINDTLIRISAVGYAGVNNFVLTSSNVSPTTIEAQALENFTQSNTGSQWNFYNAPIGSISKNLSVSINNSGVKLQAVNSAITFTDGSYQNSAAAITPNTIVSNTITTSTITVSNGIFQPARVVPGTSNTLNVNFATDSLIHFHTPAPGTTVTVNLLNIANNAGKTVEVWVVSSAGGTTQFNHSVSSTQSTNQQSFFRTSNNTMYIKYTNMDGTSGNTFVTAIGNSM